MTTDGTTLSAQRQAAKGDPELALSREDMIVKASMLLDHAGLDKQVAQAIIDGVLGLATDGASSDIVNKVCQLCR